VHLASGTVKAIATDLGFQPPVPGFTPTHFFNHVDSTGAMYVNAEGAKVIHKLR